MVTSKDANLTKAHGRYLESRLIALAQQAGRVVLDNSTAPPPQPLPEAHRSDMDYFVGQLQIILPVLGVDAIRARDVETAPRRDELVSPVFRLQQQKLGVDARVQQVDGEFTVLAGSKAVASWHGTGKAESTIKAYASYRAEHQRLVAEGAIAVQDGGGTFTRDVVFGSPSTAGAICLGRSCNGRREWIAPDGSMFGAWESRGVDSHEPALGSL